MNIILTGGSGMVGRNILEHPHAAHYNILAPRRSELDLLDESSVYSYIEKNKPDFVIHAAGKVGGIQANISAPVDFLYDNLKMGMNVIKAARSAGVTKLLNIGSSCMYPRDAPNPLSEETLLTGTLEPTNEGYALAKIIAARLCEYISGNSDYIYKTIIPCNLYGRYDKFDPETSHMVPAVIHKINEALESGATEVSIWGTGEARREFMYAGDLADFIFNAIPRFQELPQNMNIGVGSDHSVLQYYNVVAEQLGFRGTFNHDLTKPEGMNQKLVDISKLRSFSWKAKTSLADGIRETFTYYRNGIRQ